MSGARAVGAGDWSLELAADVGGAIAALRYRGRDILRPAPAGAADPLAMGCFPLMPYANRIAGGGFAFSGNRYQLPRNFGTHPHSLHGVGWQSAWVCGSDPGAMAVLSHTHDGGAAWPWRYYAEQRFTAEANRFTLHLEVRNLADGAVPMGIGFHPYFPADSMTRLRADLGAPWLIDDDCLPTHRGATGCLGDWPAGAVVQGGALIDHCFEASAAAATITYDDGASVRVAASHRLRWRHLYRPPAGDFFCIEPVSHIPDAINRHEPPGLTGLTLIEPGAALAGWMEICVDFAA